MATEAEHRTQTRNSSQQHQQQYTAHYDQGKIGTQQRSSHESDLASQKSDSDHSNFSDFNEEKTIARIDENVRIFWENNPQMRKMHEQLQEAHKIDTEMNHKITLAHQYQFTLNRLRNNLKNKSL